MNLHGARSFLNTIWSFIWLYDSKRMLPEAFVTQLSRDVMTPSISDQDHKDHNELAVLDGVANCFCLYLPFLPREDGNGRDAKC